jgi:hypothetical protein
MSPREFYYALKSKQERDSQIIEHEFKQAYKVARFQAVLLINPHLKRGQQYKDPMELIKFSWEKNVIKKQSVEEMKQELMAIAAAAKRRKTRK